MKVSKMYIFIALSVPFNFENPKLISTTTTNSLESMLHESILRTLNGSTVVYATYFWQYFGLFDIY